MLSKFVWQIFDSYNTIVGLPLYSHFLCKQHPNSMLSRYFLCSTVNIPQVKKQQDGRTHVLKRCSAGIQVSATTILLYVNLCTNTLCEHHPNSMLSMYQARTTVRTPLYNHLYQETVAQRKDPCS